MDRLFPNRVTGNLEAAVPEDTEPEPAMLVTGCDDFASTCDDAASELASRQHFLTMVNAAPIEAPLPGVLMAAPVQPVAQIMPMHSGSQ